MKFWFSLVLWWKMTATLEIAPPNCTSLLKKPWSQTKKCRKESLHRFPKPQWLFTIQNWFLSKMSSKTLSGLSWQFLTLAKIQSYLLTTRLSHHLRNDTPTLLVLLGTRCLYLGDLTHLLKAEICKLNTLVGLIWHRSRIAKWIQFFLFTIGKKLKQKHPEQGTHIRVFHSRIALLCLEVVELAATRRLAI